MNPASKRDNRSFPRVQFGLARSTLFMLALAGVCACDLERMLPHEARRRPFHYPHCGRRAIAFVLLGTSQGAFVYSFMPRAIIIPSANYQRTFFCCPRSMRLNTFRKGVGVMMPNGRCFFFRSVPPTDSRTMSAHLFVKLLERAQSAAFCCSKAGDKALHQMWAHGLL